MDERGPRPDGPGLRLTDDGAMIGVASRHAERIFVCLFDDSDAEVARIALGEREGDLHYGFLPGFRAGQKYGLRAEGPWDPHAGHRFDPAKLLVDPYARKLDRPFVFDAALTLPREKAVDTARLVPKAVAEQILSNAECSPPPPCGEGPGVGADRAASREIVPPATPTPALPARGREKARGASRHLPPKSPGLIYEVCVKAHTMRDPLAPEHLRGTIAALALPHVVERFTRLGVTHVELMPVAAWIDERHLPPLGLTNAWGYNPVVFGALDPRLAPGGMADLREAVAALRAAGVGTILDVVYNHSGESDEDGPTLSLRGLDNALYYRHGADGRLINDAGCGNSLDCTQPAVVALIVEALRRFVLEAGVEGFRFDLATSLARRPDGFDPRAPLLAAIETDPVLRGRLLIAEPWDIGPGGYQLGRFPPGWLEWNDCYRDDVRRFWRGDAHAAGAFATRLAGSADLFQREERGPRASVNFIAAHDGFTLRDLISYSGKRNHANGEDNRDGNASEICWNGGAEGGTDSAEVIARRKTDARALLATLFLSLGTPMLTAGDECGRTQGGNNNAYAQDNDTTWLDWANEDSALADFVAGLARFRADSALLTENRFLTGHAENGAPCPDVRWLRADGSAMGDHDWANADFIALTRAPAQQDGPRLHMAFNRGAAAVETTLPAARAGMHWSLAIDSSACFVGRQAIEGDRLRVGARSVVALVETARS
ncbi:MAG TPA: glycogen debranching enzyme GlgX [Rhodoblastus sp.]|mgnify:CR=1 FL=1|nr:glycogen debranching enzyme GlgX [Rhodoblastus sp.]